MTFTRSGARADSSISGSAQLAALEIGVTSTMLLSGSWHIVAAGLAGAAVGAWRHCDA